MTIASGLFAAFMLLSTLLPLVRSDYWTFRALEYPRLQKWVLLKRLGDIGSDHLPVFIQLHCAQRHKAAQPTPTPDEEDKELAAEKKGPLGRFSFLITTSATPPTVTVLGWKTPMANLCVRLPAF